MTDLREIKIADLGVSAELNGTYTKRESFVGTPYWMAPEMLKESKYAEGVDIWALGISAIDIATRKVPYSDLKTFEAMTMIKDEPPPILEGDFSPEFKDFVAQCLVKDPNDRPTASQLLRHPFVKHKHKLQMDLVTEFREESKEEEKDSAPMISQRQREDINDAMQTVVSKP